ncbi:hypothetical protein PG987_006229 [Apiospora arundinis]
MSFRSSSAYRSLQRWIASSHSCGVISDVLSDLSSSTSVSQSASAGSTTRSAASSPRARITAYSSGWQSR